MRRALFWGLVGGLVALPLDALHVATGVLHYTTPKPWMPFGLQDWWAVPLFVGAGVSLGYGHRHVAAPLARTPLPSSTLTGALIGLAALVFAYASSGLLQAWPALALAVYTAVWLAVVVGVDRSARRALVLFSLGTAVVGPAVEAALSASGAFAYTHPDVFGVALWLPGIYLNAGAAAHLLDRWLLSPGQ